KVSLTDLSLVREQPLPAFGGIPVTSPIIVGDDVLVPTVIKLPQPDDGKPEYEIGLAVLGQENLTVNSSARLQFRIPPLPVPSPDDDFTEDDVYSYYRPVPPDRIVGDG